MSAYVLRGYQREAVDRGLAYLTNPQLAGRNGIIVAPTGSGKALLVANIATALPGPCIVFQPSKEILQQNAEKLESYGYTPAIFSASVGRKEIGQVTLATIGSVVRHAEAFRDFPYVLIDECHAVNPKGGMYRDFLSGLEHARVLGLTATPIRLHSNSWGSTLRFLTRTRPRIFRDVVHVTQVADLIRDGFLAHVEYRQRPIIQREKLRLNTTGADYTDRSVQLHFAEIGFAGRLQSEVEQLLAEGRRNALVFTRFVEESEQLARAIPGAAVVTGETPDRERARVVKAFKAGEIRVCSNVGCLAVGFDFPAMESVVLARPSVSLTVHYQQIGRCIRPCQGKATAVVVDLVGLVDQFGRVEDLVISPGGKTGEQWVIKSRGRDLSNVYFGERDEHQGGKPGQSSGFNRRRYWAERRSGFTQAPGRAGDNLF